MLNRSPVIDMRNEILKFIAQATYGESFRATRVELDTNSDAPIEYDAPNEFTVTPNGETRSTKKPVPLKRCADEISASGLQILSCFLDGTRHVYKVDDISYTTSGTRKTIYPIVAAQVSVGCCRRVEKKLHAESFTDEIVLVLPDVANFDGHDGFFHGLKTKLNARLTAKNFPVNISAVLSYNTNRNSSEKFEERAVAKVQRHMHDAEIDLVARLVKCGRLDRKNYLVKDGSLEYRTLSDRKFNAKNYGFVVGVSKKFNPLLIVNPAFVAEMPTFSRTPVSIMSRPAIHGETKFAVWYLRLRDKKLSDSPFDGVVKVEKILVTDAEVQRGKIDSDEADLLSAYLLNERNPVCYGADGRWANHIYPIFLTESFIKSRSISAETFLHLF